nr:nonribosomal peptide synthetase 1 [Quercus suber]
MSTGSRKMVTIHDRHTIDEDRNHGVTLDTVRRILSDVLCLHLRDVHNESSFRDLGGDSVAALEFGARCSSMGMKVQVPDFLGCTTIDDLATRIIHRPRHHASVEAWSLAPTADRDLIEREVREQCKLLAARDSISDMYPATALQESLMALAVKHPGSYISKYQFAIANGVDIERFKTAWARVFKACPILRTRIVLVGGRSWQAVIGEDAECETRNSETIEYRKRLCRYEILPNGSEHFFCLTMHHVVFDGWCLGLLSEALAYCYHHDLPPKSLVPFVNLVRYSLNLDTLQTRKYWKTQLRACKRTMFPRLCNARVGSGSATFRQRIKFHDRPKAVTMATVLRAAWAIILAAHDDRAQDVTFGSTVIGRQVPLDRIEHIAGPVVSTVPIRVKLDQQQRVLDFLQQIQSQASGMIPFEQQQLGQQKSDASRSPSQS